ncbi:MAG: serine/threonine-protein kinase, partial [Planctomycetota bacterium]
DIKPGNLFLCEQGGALDVVKVMDFGLVKALGRRDSKLTQVGTVVGTPQYLSPESLSGEQVGPRADLYSLGAVAYELLTGRVVFEADSVGELIAQHLQAKPTPPSRHLPGLPPDLERLVVRCLQKNPDDRPESAAALRDELGRCADAGGWSAEDARAWWAEHLPGHIHEPAPLAEEAGATSPEA